MAVTFVRAEELTEARRAELERQGKLGSVVVAEKQRDVMHKDEFPPGEARALIEAELPFEFNMWHFTQLVRHLGVKPKANDPPEKTDPRYCLYDKPWKKYVYTRAFVRRCVDTINTRDKFRQVFGKDPKQKVSKMAQKAVRRQNSIVRKTSVATADAG